MAPPVSPSDQLASLAKAAKSGALRGVVARAVGSLGEGQSAFEDLGKALGEYETAVGNAKAVAAFVRQELQAEMSNGGPALTETEKQTVTAAEAGSVSDVLGNSSAASGAVAAEQLAPGMPRTAKLPG